MLVKTNQNSRTPLYVQIVNQLKEMIIREELPGGFVMPSERNMAQTLGVHRNTIVRAYNELKADGYIDSSERKGYIVVSGESQAANTKVKRNLTWSNLIKNEYINRRIETQYNGWMRRNSKYSFVGDIFAAENYGKYDLLNILAEISEENPEKFFGVSHRQGFPELKKVIIDFVASKGINTKASEIQIVSETFQAIEYIAHLLIEKGDTIIIEEPVCPEIIRIFLSLGADIKTIGIDTDGVITDTLEPLIVKYKPKLIYVNPDFQNPTGTVMSLDRRKVLLEAAYKYQIPIIEEDVCSELRFEGRRIPSLKALDKHDLVIYLYSFYYTIPSGIRVAFVIGDKDLISDLSSIISSRIVCADSISQLILTKYMESGLYKKNLDRICSDNKKKLDIMASGIGNVNDISFNIPCGGVNLWCRISNEVDFQKLMYETSERGVTFMPSNVFFLNGSKGDNYIRLNYSFSTEAEITEGMKLLVESIKSSI